MLTTFLPTYYCVGIDLDLLEIDLSFALGFMEFAQFYNPNLDMRFDFDGEDWIKFLRYQKFVQMKPVDAEVGDYIFYAILFDGERVDTMQLFVRVIEG